jgi:hypothetical protein
MNQPPVTRPSTFVTHGPDDTTPAGWRHALWLMILVAASVAFSLGFACAVPFAAFGATVALTLERREAIWLTVALWLANQVIGFTVLGYPWTAETFVWGAVLGLVAVLATLSAQTAASRLRELDRAIVVTAAFAAAFVVYEGALFAVSAGLLGGTENYAPQIVARILEINAAGFVGLLLVNRLAAMVGLTAKPAFG